MTLGLNHTRAGWAGRALDTYRRQVGDNDDATLIVDLITDLGHLARQRKLDFVHQAARALSVWDYECASPDGIDPGPHVSITIAGRRPKYAWRERGGRP
jgi:hypothetical protein